MTEWPEPVDRVARVLRTAAIDARVEEFPEGAATAQAAADAIGCELAQIVKSIVVVCDGAFVLALVPGDARADLAAIASIVGAADARVANPDEVIFATGFPPGGVAPFPVRAIVRTLMEASLLRHNVVWIGAGTSEHMAALAPHELQRLTRASAVNLTAPR